MVTQTEPVPALSTEPLAPVSPLLGTPEVGVVPPPAAPAPIASPEVPTPVGIQPPVQPAITPQMEAAQRALEERERQVQVAEGQLIEQTIVQAQEQYARHLETTYQLSPEYARTLAQAEATSARRIYQLERQVRDSTSEGQRKVRLAVSLANQQGLGMADVEKLLEYRTEQEMRLGAVVLKSQNSTLSQANAQIAKLQEQVNKLMQGTVQPQQFDSGNTLGGGLAAANNDNIDKLYMDWDRAHQGTANPYEAQYRRFLGYG